jgi:hypothetical protein
MLHFESLKHAQDQGINGQTACPLLEGERTYGGRRNIDADDPKQKSRAWVNAVAAQSAYTVYNWGLGALLVARREGMGSLKGMATTETHPMPEATLAGRLRALAQRCREVSQWTTVPDVVRELDGIAESLSREADRVESK